MARHQTPQVIETVDAVEPCALCGRSGGCAGIAPDQRISICRGCIEALFGVTHADEHSFDPFGHCGVCAKVLAARGEERKVTSCRYQTIRCDEKGPRCLHDAVIDVGFHGLIRLPPGWSVCEMEAMVDFHRFVCPPCTDDDHYAAPSAPEATS